MEPLVGRLEVPVHDDDGNLQAHFKIAATLGDDGLPKCREIALVAVEGREVTRDLIPLAAKEFQELLDVLGARLYAEIAAQRLTEGVVTIGSGEDAVAMEIGPNGPLTAVTIRPGEEWVAERVKELRKRRRSVRGDDDYRQVAEVYRRAQAEGFPVQEAVEKSFSVSRPHAARLISEARRRGFLPKTTRGKAKS